MYKAIVRFANTHDIKLVNSVEGAVFPHNVGGDRARAFAAKIMRFAQSRSGAVLWTEPLNVEGAPRDAIVTASCPTRGFVLHFKYVEKMFFLVFRCNANLFLDVLL